MNKCDYPGEVCHKPNKCYDNPHYDEDICAIQSKQYDDCVAQNERRKLYAILPIALVSMIGGFFIPNKTVGVSISIGGLLLLMNVVWDNWYKMDEGIKLSLMAVTFIILVYAGVNYQRLLKHFKIE